MHPLAARSLFGLPAAELSVTEYDGRQVLDRRATATQQQLTECRDWSDAFALLGGHLTRSLDRHRRVEVRSELRHAWSLLEASGGQRPIAEVAAQVGLTPRHLGTLFRREVGQSPKADRPADPVPALRGADQDLGQPDRSRRPGRRGGSAPATPTSRT